MYRSLRGVEYKEKGSGRLISDCEDIGNGEYKEKGSGRLMVDCDDGGNDASNG